MTVPIVSDFAHDVVESNGKTVRQNNLTIGHEIPMGALVEITTDCPIGQFSSEYKGVRLFVVGHKRDCDGTPLYSLSFDPNAHKELADAQKTFDDNTDSKFISVFGMRLGEAAGSVSNGWGPESLIVIDPQPRTRKSPPKA